MNHSTRHGLRCAAALAALTAALTPARAEPGAGQPDPLNARAEVPALTYASPLAGYRSVGELKLGSWKEANDTVTRIGGWRAYAREASQPAPAPAAAPLAAPTTAPSTAPSTAAPAAPAAAAAASRAMPGHDRHGKH